MPTLSDLSAETIEARIELLSGFLSAIRNYFDSNYGEGGEQSLRSRINKQLRTARTAVKEADCWQPMVGMPPPAVGGLVM